MKDENHHIKIKKTEIMDAIKRSGYLMESRIANYLRKLNFYVNTNQVILDKNSGKSREIDIVAEKFENFEKDYATIQNHYIMELKNNPNPLVLINKFEWTPSFDYDPYRICISNFKDEDFNLFVNMEDIIKNKFERFTQYCSFSRKNGSKELQALHPEETHSGIQKIIQYCDEASNIDISDSFKRMFIYLPVLVLGGDLYKMNIYGKNKHSLKKINYSSLLYSYYLDNKEKNILIFIVTEKGFTEFISYFQNLSNNLFKQIISNK